jgi:hypothetical protein
MHVCRHTARKVVVDLGGEGSRRSRQKRKEGNDGKHTNARGGFQSATDRYRRLVEESGDSASGGRSYIQLGIIARQRRISGGGVVVKAMAIYTRERRGFDAAKDHDPVKPALIARQR